MRLVQQDPTWIKGFCQMSMLKKNSRPDPDILTESNSSVLSPAEQVTPGIREQRYLIM